MGVALTTLKLPPRRPSDRDRAPACLWGPGPSHSWSVDPRLGYGHGLWWSGSTLRLYLQIYILFPFLVSFYLETVSPQPERLCCTSGEHVSRHPATLSQALKICMIRAMSPQHSDCSWWKKNRDGTNPCLEACMNIKCKSVRRSHSIKWSFPLFSFKGVFSFKVFAS